MTNFECIESLPTVPVSEKVRVCLKGFVHSHRTGKSVSFLILRQGISTLQCVYTKKDIKAEEEKSLAVTNTTEKQSQRLPGRYMSYTKISVESYVKVHGYLVLSPVPILSCSVTHLELQISSIEVVSVSADLPFALKTSNEIQKTSERPSFKDLKITKTPGNSLGEKEPFSEIQIDKSKKNNKNSKLEDMNNEITKENDKKNCIISDTPHKNTDLVNQTVSTKLETSNTTHKNMDSSNQSVSTKLETLFDNRYLDLRQSHTHCIFTIIDGFYHFIRKFLREHNFVEIKTPKIIQGSTEGGCNLFSLQYFKRVAYLAQSPQLYKQMAIIGGLQRVFEIGHVYRQEESNTNRYLSEFIGLDLEMEVEAYGEVVHFVFEMIKMVFTSIQAEYQKEIEIVRSVYPFKDVVLSEKPVILSFIGAKWLLNAYKFNKELLSKGNNEDSDYNSKISKSAEIESEKNCSSQKFEETLNYYKINAEKIYTDLEIRELEIKNLLNDFNREEERKLGEIVKEIYKSDLFVVIEYPTSERAFYTSPKDSILSNSFDFILRGEEILSGALRINDLSELKKSLKLKNINENSLEGYLKAFRNGVPKHGGCGIGFERMLKCFFGGNDIRMFTMFPRDPNRLYP